jgi:hypothetical protein
MAPEVCEGESATAASDQYALAVIAYQMLTGQLPFTAATPMAVIVAQVNKALPLPRSVNPDLSEATEQVLLKGLARRAEDRFASCTELARALGSIRSDGPEPEPARAPALARRLPKPTLLAAGAAALVLLLALTAGYVATRPARQAAPTSPALRSTPTAPPTSQPTPSPAGTSKPAHAIPAKGELLFDAQLSGQTDNYLCGYLDRRQSPADSAVWSRDGGVLTISLTKAQGSLRCSFSGPTPSSYVWEMDVTSTADSAGKAYVTFRSSGGQPGEYYAAVVDTKFENLSVIRYNSGSYGPQGEAMAPAPLTGLKQGKVFTLAIQEKQADFAVYVNESEVGRFSLGGFTGARFDDAIQLGDPRDELLATVKISGWRLYALP